MGEKEEFRFYMPPIQMETEKIQSEPGPFQ